MKNITLTTNFHVTDKVEVAKQIIEKLRSYNINITLPSFAKNVFCDTDGLKFADADHLYDGAEMVVVIGGDGSVLDCARRVSEGGIPILAINKGRLGYMTSLEVNELDRIENVIKGEYTIDTRSMLLIEVKNKDRTLYVSQGLNDVVVSNGSIARIVDLELYANGMKVGDYRADGLIVSTPTGSTAYSLSAGGPIMAPGVKAFCVTPICPHSFSSRPIVFPDDSVLEIKNVCSREPNLFITVDGRINIRLGRYQTVRVTRSDYVARIVRVKENNFYSDLYKKLTAL
jgi:NAD+ kinase